MKSVERPDRRLRALVGVWRVVRYGDIFVCNQPLPVSGLPQRSSLRNAERDNLIDLVQHLLHLLHTCELTQLTYRVLACRLTWTFASCLERQFPLRRFPHVVAGRKVAVL